MSSSLDFGVGGEFEFERHAIMSFLGGREFSTSSRRIQHGGFGWAEFEFITSRVEASCDFWVGGALSSVRLKSGT